MEDLGLDPKLVDKSLDFKKVNDNKKKLYAALDLGTQNTVCGIIIDDQFCLVNGDDNIPSFVSAVAYLDDKTKLFSTNEETENEVKEEKFTNESDEDELEIPAFLRRQKN